MARPTTAVIDLPVGPKPDWELENQEELTKDVFESCALFHSLRQSRERWITSTFPRFSTKARGGGKVVDHIPLPHTIQTRGKCDFGIGPHIFLDTVFYEVHYLPAQKSALSKVGEPSSGTALGGTWQSKTSYEVQTQNTHAIVTVESHPELTGTSHLSPPPVATITPELINLVNAAASSNPILANLLQLAAAGQATPDQLKTLGLLIQSLAPPQNVQTTTSASDSQSSLPLPSFTTSQAPLPAPIRQFDLVLEFSEAPYERWLFPRGANTYERVVDPSNPSSFDTIIKTQIPFRKSRILEAATMSAPLAIDVEEEDSRVVSFRLKKTPLDIWDTISRWGGDQQQLQESMNTLRALVPPDRVYLRHHLSLGPLLSQLQAVVVPYTMKPLKATVSASSRANRTNRKTRKQDNNETALKASATKEVTLKAKKRKVSQAEKNGQATQIRCLSCSEADVPLMLGGRFCRPCVEKGLGVPVPPSAPPPPAPVIVSNLDATIIIPEPPLEKETIPQHQT